MRLIEAIEMNNILDGHMKACRLARYGWGDEPYSKVMDYLNTTKDAVKNLVETKGETKENKFETKEKERNNMGREKSMYLNGDFKNEILGIFKNGAKNYIRFMNTWVMAIRRRDDGVYTCQEVMPVIKEVSVIGDSQNFKKVVVVKFADFTEEKAVLNDNDTFNLEHGISICVTKKLFSQITEGRISGTSLYNKVISHGMRVYKNNLKAAEAAEAKNRELEERAAKIEAKKQRRKAQRESAKREAAIEIQKEAYLRALKEYGQINNHF